MPISLRQRYFQDILHFTFEMSEGGRKERPATRSTKAAAAEQQQLTLATLVTELEKARSNITEALKASLLLIQTTLEAVKRQVEAFEARFKRREHFQTTMTGSPRWKPP